MDTFLQDVRFGWRLLGRAPAFTAAVVVALALGVGATTAVFTLLDRVVLRPLPYPDPDNLVTVWETNGSQGLSHERLSPVNFMDYRRLAQAFDDAAAWWYPQLNLTEPGRDPVRVNAVETSANFFSVIGVAPLLGSAFPAQPLYAREPVVVISHRLWRERFDGNPALIGQTVTLNDQAFAVIGVMPPGFNYPDDTDVWQRLTWPLEQHSRGAHFMESLFRLKRGVTLDQANAELRALTTRLDREYTATNGGWRARAVPLADEVEGYFRPALFALFGAAGLLLVITCTNVASLLLARATVREREVAVRAAIGASRVRLVRQFLTEAVMLALLGAILGVAVAIAGVKLLIIVSPIDIPRLDASGLGVDARVLGFGTMIAALTAMAFGLVPAFFMARGDVQRSLSDAGRSGGGAAAGRRARQVLVSAEVALAVMLLVGASLLARAFQRLLEEDPGFHPARIVTVDIQLPYSYNDFRKIADFYARLLESVRRQPGVIHAGATTFLPLDAAWRLPFMVSGRPRPSDNDMPQAQQQVIDDDYFRTIGVPLMKGRLFDARDDVDAPGAVIVNEAMARREWPNADPLAQAITTFVRYVGPMGTMLMPPNTSFRVIGVIANMKNQSLVRDTEPAIFFTFRQFSFRELHLVVQGGADEARLVGAVRASVQQLDPNLPLAHARTLASVLGEATDRPRALMMLMVAFASLALLLAALGIYGVLAYGVSQRRQEISVRMALGAQAADVLWLVVGEGMWLATIGGAAGAAGALALGRTLSGLLYGVSTADPLAFAAAAAVALIAALAACWLPARRAATLDPLAGLRTQ